MLPFLGGAAAVHQPTHAFLDEAAGLLADRVPINAGDPAAFGDALVLKHDATNDFIVMLDADTVRLWRMRWLGLQAASLKDLSITERLSDAPKPGAPARITAEQVCQVVALACEAPQQAGCPISQWTAREIADEIMERGIID